jgi:hypothetical protein
MVVERINNEIVVRIPSHVANMEDIQRFIDLIVYKEATSHSQANQEDIDKIVKDAKKGWWATNRKQYIHHGKSTINLQYIKSEKRII